jgi:hypothetical protein
VTSGGGGGKVMSVWQCVGGGYGGKWFRVRGSEHHMLVTC